MSDNASNRSSKWIVCNSELPSREVIFFAQVIILYVIICVSIAHISLGIGNSTLWSTLLAGSLGYLLPSPHIASGRGGHESLLPHVTEQQLDGVLPRQHADEFHHQTA